MISHNFNDSLRASHRASDWPGWEPLYREAFPAFLSMNDHRQDGYHQRAGVDRSIVLHTSKIILVDEKVLRVDYGDIALEVWSDQARRVPGWVCKPLLADYIAYLVAPAGKCYLLPVPQLQAAWAVNGERWRREYPRPILAHNDFNGRSWITESTGVPVNVLFAAIGARLRVCFDPFEVVD